MEKSTSHLIRKDAIKNKTKLVPRSETIPCVVEKPPKNLGRLYSAEFTNQQLEVKQKLVKYKCHLPGSFRYAANPTGYTKVADVAVED